MGILYIPVGRDLTDNLPVKSVETINLWKERTPGLLFLRNFRKNTHICWIEHLD